MSDFIDDVASLYVAAGYGVLGTTIFFSTRSMVPNGDGPYTSLIETGGISPERTHNRIAPSYIMPGLQNLVRAKNSEDAKALIKLHYAIVSVIRNQFINSVWYRDIKILQEPFDNGIDEQGRSKYVFNIVADRRP